MEFKSPDKWYRRENFKTIKRPYSPSPNNKDYEKKIRHVNMDKMCTYIHPVTNQRCSMQLGDYPEFCKFHTMLIDNVYIDISKIRESGNGLFAGPHGFNKGDIIGKYSYEWNSVSLRRLKERCKDDNCWNYVFCVGEECWDGRYIRSTLMRNINDAHGSNFKNNAFFDVKNNNVYVIASRNIKPHSEIYVSYGKHYWNK